MVDVAQVAMTHRLGMRRIDCVRVVLDGERSRAEVDGVMHRLPRTVRVPLATASALAAEGVRLVVERRGDGDRR